MLDSSGTQFRNRHRVERLPFVGSVVAERFVGDVHERVSLSALDCVQVFKNGPSPSQVDLLLTNVVLEGGGGAEVIRVVTEIIPQAKVLAMSGYADDETLRRGISRGQYPFISKPFTADLLSAAVDKALG